MLLALLLVVHASAQSETPAVVTPPAGTCEAYTGDSCTDYVASAFVQTGSTQASLELAVAGQLQNAAPLQSVAPNCYGPLKSFLCTSILQNCTLNQTPSLPAPPCRSVCDTVNTECAAIFAQAGIPALNCATFPLSSVTYTTGSVLCNTAQPFTDVPPPTINCPAPLAYNPDSIEAIPCEIPCKVSFFTKSHTDGLFLAKKIMLSISIVCLTVMVAAFLNNPAKRAFPANLLTIYLVAQWIVQWFMMMTYFYSDEDLRCKSKFVPASSHNAPLCVFQYSGVMFFSLVQYFFWAAAAFNLFSLVVLGRESHPEWNKFYHGLTWPLALLLTLIPIGMKRVEYFSFIGWCWIDPNSDQLNDSLYFAWIWISWIVGNVCILAVTWKMRQVFAVALSLSASNPEHVRMLKQRQIRANMRTLAYLVLMDVIILLTLSNYYINRDRKNAITRIITDYVVCQFNNPTAPELCPYKEPMSFATNTVSYCATAGQGILAFLFFGLDKNLYVDLAQKIGFSLTSWSVSHRQSQQTSETRNSKQPKSVTSGHSIELSP